MYQPRAWILTIGNEILIGRIVNTNASWLAERLTLLGAKVRRILVVPDELDEIARAFHEAVRSADIVVSTGGLGPTDDDMTLEGLSLALARPLRLHPKALEMVERFYSSRGYGLTRERVKMAFLPEGAEPIPNPVGAAPGAFIVAGRSHVVALPGVPAEMKAMFDEYVVELLRPILPRLCVRDVGRVYRGIPESSLAPLLRRASRLCPDCYVKSHPKGHEVEEPVIEVRVLASAPSCGEAEDKARRVLEELDRLIAGGDGRGEPISQGAGGV